MTAMQRATKRQRSRSSSSRDAALVGALSIFDLTGAVIYAIARRALAAKKPNPSATEPFRESARIISRARDEAVGASSRG
jgi:hypothetical protein